MAEKTATSTSIPTPDPSAFAETATKAVEDAVAKAQNQYLAMLSESQNLALDAYKTMIDSVGKLNLPVLPGMPPVASMAKMPVQMLDSAFGFGAAVLDSQRAFTKKMLELSAS